MDDDPSARARRWAALISLAWCVMAAEPGGAQTLHGQTQLQYQSVDRSRSLPTTDTWAKTLQLDYAQRLPGAVDFSSSFRFVEQTVARQATRLRAPEGTVRLAHRNFGLTTGYRPIETRDARGTSTRQQSVNVTGYLQQEKLPRLTGSWVRSHLDSNLYSPSTATVTRTLGAQYALPHLNLRAGYGDRSLEGPAEIAPRRTESHITLGSSSQFQVGRAPVSLQYDYAQARMYPASARAVFTRTHTAGGSTGFPIARRASTALSYNYRRTEVPSRLGATQEHNGALSLAYALSPAVQLSAGGGLRSVILGGRAETERYLAASAAAQGEARPGWRLSASASHSVNWLPGAGPRSGDGVEAGTTMRLARGLDLRGSLGVSTSRPVTSDGLQGPRQVSLQSSAGIAASPLRFVYLDGNVARNRSGHSLLKGGPASTSYATGMRLIPHARLQTSGRWGLTRAPGGRSSSFQGSAQWTPGSRFQVSGGYSHARQETTVPVPVVTTQESLSGALTTALARDLNASVGYAESNHGRPNRVRQLTINVVHTFGR